MSKIEFEKFFSGFSAFKSYVERSKKRGNNSYNPLSEIRASSDEVGLHSRILASFLNPHGKHYQDDLFLRLFLNECALSDWFDTNNAKVYKERNNIDIYITNDRQHIIIENKIYALDQERQIERYIEALAGGFESLDSIKSREDSNIDSKDSIESSENIAVIYLSLNGKKPSKSSLGKWEINGESLESSGVKIPFRCISYKKDILHFLNACKSEIGNITNLNAALEFYKDIVLKITNQKGDKMAITSFLDSEEKYAMAFEINEIKRADIDNAYLENFILKKCKKRDGETWNLSDNKSFSGDDKWKHNIVIYNETHFKQTFRFMFCKEERKNIDKYGIRLFIRYGGKDDFMAKGLREIATKVANKVNADISNVAGSKDSSVWWFKDKIYKSKDINKTIDLVNKVNDFLATDSNIAKIASELEKYKS